MQINDIQKGDIFSETPYYIFKEKENNILVFDHHPSKKEVRLDEKYVENLLTSADQFEKEIEVGKIDTYWTSAQIASAIKKGDLKKDEVNAGDLKKFGIRTIFENIGTQVFTVCFQKADKPVSKKAKQDKIDNKVTELVNALESAKKNKKSIIDAAKAFLEDLVKDQISDFEPGEMRVLRGYKQQFNSADGRYNCMDMDIMQTRPVNINTIQWICVDNIRYILK